MKLVLVMLPFSCRFCILVYIYDDYEARLLILLKRKCMLWYVQKKMLPYVLYLWSFGGVMTNLWQWII